jgi:hypothetical protein
MSAFSSIAIPKALGVTGFGFLLTALPQPML